MMKRLTPILVLCIFMFAGVQSATALNIPTETTILDAGGNPITVGSWDSTSRIYTLTANVSEGLVVGQSNLIFDGAGYTIQGPGSGDGIFLGNTTDGGVTRMIDVTVKNVTIIDFSIGIHLVWSDDDVLMDNTIDASSYGIWLEASHGNSLTGNTTSGSHEGVRVDRAHSNTITSSTMSHNDNGIVLWYADNNQIYNNNFVDYSVRHASVTGGSGNVFHLAAPIGGNYWDDWTTPDTDNNGIVDGPYIFTGGQDDLPWAQEDGWLTTTPTNNPPVAKAQNIEVNADSVGLANVTAADVDDGSSDPDGDSLTLSLVPAGPFGKGVHTVTLTVTDGDLTDTAEATVTVNDLTAPVIVLDGEASMVLPCGGTYTELGAMAVDNCDGDVPVIIGGGVVDTAVCGIYTVTYDAADDSGNAAEQIIRTVEVVAAPVIVIAIDLLTDTVWPPNNKMVHVANISASGLCDAVMTVSVTSDETIRECDWQWEWDADTGTGELYVRARRDGRGDGRVYFITATAEDGSSDPATATAEVTVPHDQCDDDDDDDDDDRKGRKKGKKDKGGKKGKGRNRGGRRR